MATYIKDDSLDNLQQSMSMLAQLSSQRKARDLETAIALNRMGKNREAEKLLLSSQRGLIGNAFGKNAQEWEAQNTFRGKEIGLQSLIETPEKQQVQTLKDLNAVKQLEKIYGKNTDALNQQLGLMGLAQTPKDIISGYEQKLAQNKVIESFNKKAETYNKSLADIPQTLKGNEVDQQQLLLENTMNAVQNGGGLAAYNRYLTTGKAIADHYGHNFQPMPAAYFGIGNGKGSGGGSKSDYYLYGNTEQVIEIPAWAMKTSKSREEYIAKNYPDIYVQGTILKRAGTNSGETLNPLQKEQQRQTKMENDAAELAKAEEVKRQSAGWLSGSRKDIDNANTNLSAIGSPIRYDYNGNPYRVDASSNTQNTASTEKKEEPKPEEKQAKKSHSGIWN